MSTLTRNLVTAAIAVLCAGSPGLAQKSPPLVPLYQPRAIKAAFDKHTRSADGRPGSAYWQTSRPVHDHRDRCSSRSDGEGNGTDRVHE